MKEKRDSFITNLATVLSKIIEIAHWIGAVTMVVLAVVSCAGQKALENMIKMDSPLDNTISTYGFELKITDASGALDAKAVLMYAISAAIILSLFAMVFRNVYLILKKIKGNDGQIVNPFQNDVIRMVREIGIFLISVPVVGLTMSVISRLVLGAEYAEISVSLDSILIGIVVLCLSHVFSYGNSLQNDVDGLV